MGVHGRVHPARTHARCVENKTKQNTAGELMSFSSFVRSAAPKEDVVNWQAARVMWIIDSHFISVIDSLV